MDCFIIEVVYAKERGF